MISVIIPAHNEAAVILETLRAIAGPAGQIGLEILVICNGCTDDTARIAGGVPGVRVLHSEAASKTGAINLGLREARGESVVCLDADIRLLGTGLKGLAAALERPGVLAAAPRVEMDFAPGTPQAVRRYYRLWLSLAYVRDGMVGCGVYALNRQGLARLGQLPEVIADDGYVRGSFSPEERSLVQDAVALVRAPRTVRDLTRIKTRSRLGGYELRLRFPHGAAGQNEGAHHSRAWLAVLWTPSLWSCVPAYVYVNVVSRLRARRQLTRLEDYTWERDESSRTVAEAVG